MKGFSMISNNRRILVIALLFLFISLNVLAKEEIFVITGGDIHTISKGVIKKGRILVENGKIVSIGQEIKIPRGAKRINAKGLIITPGIIDARSHFGLRVPRDYKEFIKPARKITEHFAQFENPTWLKCGVTATYVTPPSYDHLGGFGAVVKLVGMKEEAVINEMAGMSVSFGESAIMGMRRPTTRQGRIGRLRQEFIRAIEYKERRRKGGSEEGGNPNCEAVVRVINGEVPLRAYVNTPDDIMTALRFAKEFDLKLIIDSGAGAHRVAHILAEAQVPVVVGPSIMGLGSGGPFEMSAHTPENAARLNRAGVKVALSTDSRGGRSVLLEGVVAKSHGLPEDVALRAVTLNAAEILGVADRLGSIEPGKDADVVIWKGHPLNTWGEARTVIVNGKIVYEKAKSKT